MAGEPNRVVVEPDDVAAARRETIGVATPSAPGVEQLRALREVEKMRQQIDLAVAALAIEELLLEVFPYLPAQLLARVHTGDVNPSPAGGSRASGSPCFEQLSRAARLKRRGIYALRPPSAPGVPGLFAIKFRSSTAM